MNNGFRMSALLGVGLALWVIDVPTDGAPVRSASAIIGRPLTPFSYAGVARRTTRRVVYADAAMVGTATAAAVAYAPPPAPPAAAPPVGAIVNSLPPNCEPATIGGVAYSYCGGTYYRAGFQGNNVVYIVSRP